MSVLFPAPFSPIRASTSPLLRMRETPRSAITPGNRLVMPLISSSAGVPDTYFFKSASFFLNSSTFALLMISTPVSIALLAGIVAIVASVLVASSCIHLLAR